MKLGDALAAARWVVSPRDSPRFLLVRFKNEPPFLQILCRYSATRTGVKHTPFCSQTTKNAAHRIRPPPHSLSLFPLPPPPPSSPHPSHPSLPPPRSPFLKDPSPKNIKLPHHGAHDLVHVRGLRRVRLHPLSVHLLRPRLHHLRASRRLPSSGREETGPFVVRAP